MLKLLKLRSLRAEAFDHAARGLGDDLGQLMQRCRAGDASAVRTLLVALGPPMLLVIRRVLGSRHPDVEDTLQDATIALLRALPGFRGDCSARHFACRIATFTAISARRRHRAANDEPSPDDVDEQPSPDSEHARDGDWAVAANRRALVRRLLDELPDSQAEALVLHCVAGLTVDELAAATGVPLETARSRLRLARAALRARIVNDREASELMEDLR